MKKILLAGVVALAVTLSLGAAFVHSGLYNIAADEKHWRLTEGVLTAMRVRSIEARARDIEVPNLDGPKLVLKGAGQYAEMCVGCHRAPGVPESPLRQGLYPQPPDLTRNDLDARAAFWVIKHGLKMTAMPAWGASHDDDTLWSLVAFLKKLPSLDVDQYREMAAQAPPDQEMRPGGHPAGHAEPSERKSAMPDTHKK